MLFRSAPCIGAPFLRRADHGGDCTQLPVQEFKQMQTVRIVGRASAPRARLGACQFVITGAQQSADQPLESLELSLAPDSRCNPACLVARSEEHTSELQSLMRISYAVFCLKKKKNNKRR